MRYMYISSGCFVCVWDTCILFGCFVCVWDTCIYHLVVLSVYEIHIYIIWVFCLCIKYMYRSSECFICVWDTCIYHLGVLSVYDMSVYTCTIWLFCLCIYLWYTCLYHLGVFSDFRNVPPCTVYLSIIIAVIFWMVSGFFLEKLASLFRISALSCDFPCLERPLHGGNIADTT